MKKNSFKALISLSFCFLFLGCTKNESSISVQKYNNQILSYQIQAIDTVERYFSSLEKDYNGQNLAELYVQMRDQLTTLSSQLALESDRKGDTRLKNTVAAYLSGLQEALNQYEMPIVEALGVYSGSASDFYRQDKEKVNQYTLAFAKVLAQLDEQIEQQQAIFAEKYRYSLK